MYEPCGCPRRGAWRFCPWCGKQLAKAAPTTCVVCGAPAWCIGGKYCRVHSPVLNPRDYGITLEEVARLRAEGATWQAIMEHYGLKSYRPIFRAVVREWRPYWKAFRAYDKHLPPHVSGALESRFVDWWNAGQPERPAQDWCRACLRQFPWGALNQYHVCVECAGETTWTGGG